MAVPPHQLLRTELLESCFLSPACPTSSPVGFFIYLTTFYQLFLPQVTGTIISCLNLGNSLLTGLSVVFMSRSKSQSPYNDIQGLTHLATLCYFSDATSPCSHHSSLAISGPHPTSFHCIDFALAIPVAQNVCPPDICLADAFTSKSVQWGISKLIHLKFILNILLTIIQ